MNTLMAKERICFGHLLQRSPLPLCVFTRHWDWWMMIWLSKVSQFGKYLHNSSCDMTVIPVSGVASIPLSVPTSAWCMFSEKVQSRTGSVLLVWHVLIMTHLGHTTPRDVAGTYHKHLSDCRPKWALPLLSVTTIIQSFALERLPWHTCSCNTRERYPVRSTTLCFILSGSPTLEEVMQFDATWSFTKPSEPMITWCNAVYRSTLKSLACISTVYCPSLPLINHPLGSAW